MVNEQVVWKLWVRRKKLFCMRVINVFDPLACNSRIMRVSWQVYYCHLKKLANCFVVLPLHADIMVCNFFKQSL